MSRQITWCIAFTSALLGILCFLPQFGVCLPQDCLKNDLVGDIELYLMSKDPRGAAAILVVAPFIQQYPNLRLTIDYIASILENGSIHSPRGQEEVEGDIWGLCSIQLYSNSTYLDYLICLSQEYADIPSNVESCAIQSGLDLSRMQLCVKNDGASLLQVSLQRTHTAGLGAFNESALCIDGQLFAGPFTTNGIRMVLCSAGEQVGVEWWFYMALALAIMACIVIVLTGLAACHLYAKCLRASDMWLNMMIKTDPGYALDFADKVQDAMHRFEKDGVHTDLGGPPLLPGTAAVDPSGSVMEEGLHQPINASLFYSPPPKLPEERTPPASFDELSSTEGTPLLPTYLNTSWAMGGVRDLDPRAERA